MFAEHLNIVFESYFILIWNFILNVVSKVIGGKIQEGILKGKS